MYFFPLEVFFISLFFKIETISKVSLEAIEVQVDAPFLQIPWHYTKPKEMKINSKMKELMTVEQNPAEVECFRYLGANFTH